MKKMKAFNVAGVTFRNKPIDSMTRLDLISKYCSHGSDFYLEREPDNSFDENAVQVRQLFKSGGSIQLGYVPKKFSEEFACLMDYHAWNPEIKFGRKFIDEKTGDCKGMQLRYEPYGENLE